MVANFWRVSSTQQSQQPSPFFLARKNLKLMLTSLGQPTFDGLPFEPLGVLSCPSVLGSRL